MEDSCPATPLILTGRDSKSPLQVAISSPESESVKSPSRDSPDSRCVICLGRLQNKSFTDSCLHQFCFQCLLQWSKIKAECPLCKQPFKSIIHNVRSNLDYDQYHVDHGEPRYVLSDLMHSYNFDLIPVEQRFRYRSTMTRHYFRELAESFLVHSRRLPESSYQINPLVPVDPAPASNYHRSNRPHASSSQQSRMRQRGTSDFRRSVYAQDLWVQDLADISGRYRECTPQFYRENPAQIHRIIPWLNREVNVLLSDCQSHAAYVLTQIVALLTEHPIRSKEFRDFARRYFGDNTDHFIHEFYIFARSVYDIAGFDQNAVYGTNPNYSTEVQEISSSSADNDSDIEVLETVKTEEKKSKKSSRQGLRKLLLKRATESKPDEPVAGPSGISSGKVSESIEICDSDAEDVKVLDFVKPEPEVVTLSSGEDVPGYSDLDTTNGEYAEVINSESSRARRDSQRESEKKKSRSRSGKGKCKSNGFGLKGKQKRKYLKSKKHRSSSSSTSTSTSSTSSTSSSSSSSSTSSSSDCSWTCSSSSSSSCNSDCISISFYERKRCRSESSSSRSSHKLNKIKKKKSKVSRKKLKKKASHKSSKRHKTGSDTEKKKKKKVRSCVIVPHWPNDSSLDGHRRLSANDGDQHRSLKSYWSIAMDGGWQESEERKAKRKHLDSSGEKRSKKRSRSSSCSSGRSLGSGKDVIVSSAVLPVPAEPVPSTSESLRLRTSRFPNAAFRRSP